MSTNRVQRHRFPIIFVKYSLSAGAIHEGLYAKYQAKPKLTMSTVQRRNPHECLNGSWHSTVAALSALLWIGGAWVQIMPCSMDGMKNMSSPLAVLAIVNELSAGDTLTALIKLKNGSAKPDLFRATRRAAPVSIAVMNDGTKA